MEPQIQYCRASDGVSIAYTRDGSGTPFIMAPNLWANISFAYRVAPRMLESNAARGWETILPDARGTGASQRDVANVSLDTRVADLEAVVDHLGLAPFVLMGVSHGGPSAIAYAARHPERVSHLLLANTYARGAAYYTLAPVMRAFASIEAMARDQWEFYTRTAANAVLGFGEPELAEKLAALYIDSITPDMLVWYREASRDTDVTEMLGSVSCPTLVLDDKGSALRVEELSRELASGIPHARLVTFQGIGRELGGEAMQQAIDEFFGFEPHVETGTVPTSAVSAAMAVILFADIADSTALTEGMGDAAFRAASRTLDERVRSAMRDNGGTAVDGKVLGDGVMGVFASAAQAIAAARVCVEAGADLPLHIGLHAGDVIREADNVFGGAVNIASRICALCAPGEILVSQTVRDLARTSAGVSFEDRGEQALKGIEDPVRVFAVRGA